MRHPSLITVALALSTLTAASSSGCAASATGGTGGAGGAGAGGKGTGGAATTSSSGSATSTASASASSSASSSATASTSASASTSGTGGGPECLKDADCSALGDSCNVGACASGKCVKSPAFEMGLCDDGKFCTVNDSCMGGVCVGAARFCLSGGPCLVGSCNEAVKMCELVPGNDGGPCDDGDPCTGGGSCMAGGCLKGTPVDCSIFDSQCTKGVCNPQFGCYGKPANNGKPCDDGKFCTLNDTCASGSCSGGPTCPPTGSVCMVNVCNEAMKTCTITPNPNSVACNDKNPCTAGETCQPGGLCGAGVPANEGSTCDDNNVCTSGDACMTGVCVGAPIVQCMNGDFCCPPGCSSGNDNDCP